MDPRTENAIKWIDALPNYKQPRSKEDRGRLGDAESGYCCLGVGCVVLDLTYHREHGTNYEFANLVGLRDDTGNLLNRSKFFNKTSLTLINDETNAGFKRIADFLKTKPELVFEEIVATELKAHYSK